MTEHEKLKWICDTINNNNIVNIYHNNTYLNRFWNVADVREIIFTPVFINKYYNYINKKKIFLNLNILMQNLDDPVEYLFNLIKD